MISAGSGSRGWPWLSSTWPWGGQDEEIVALRVRADNRGGWEHQLWIGWFGTWKACSLASGFSSLGTGHPGEGQFLQGQQDPKISKHQNTENEGHGSQAGRRGGIARWWVGRLEQD